MKNFKYFFIPFLIIAMLFMYGCSSNKNGFSLPETTTTSTTLAPKPILIAAVGDISCSTSQRKSRKNDCQDAQVAQLIRSKNPDHLFLLGDIQYNSGERSQYLQNFIPIWGDMLPIAKPVIGNHDLAKGSSAFYEFFPQVKKPGYYTFDISDTWRVIALNTNDDCKYVKCDSGSDQYKWLESQLQSSYDKCIITMQHHPRDSSGPHGNNWAIKHIDNLYYKYGVSLSLSAHDHHYERFDVLPPRIIAGTGGKENRKTGNPAPGSAYIVDDTHGALFLEVHDYYIISYFVAIDGTVHDQQTINCVTR